MFICNFKVNSKNILKLAFIIAIIIAIMFFIISTIKIFKASNVFTTNDELPNKGIYTITSSNYTNVLKSVHENLDTYVGQKIQFEGYVYKIPTITSTQFILARDMIINSNLQTLVVGFLCEYKETVTLTEKTWIKVTGEIQKGNYNGEIPVVKIITLETIEKPSDEYVYPPDSGYVPTSALL